MILRTEDPINLLFGQTTKGANKLKYLTFKAIRQDNAIRETIHYKL